MTIVHVPVRAADTYRFETTTSGLYPVHSQGNIVVDGKRWRMRCDNDPGTPQLFDVIISTEQGELIALNDTNHTWYRLKSRRPLEIDPYLFTFTYAEAISTSKVKASVQPGAAEADSDHPTSRIIFSYRFDAKVSSERVPGDLWGEIRVWAKAGLKYPELPWKPFDLRTGFDSVDEAIKGALATLPGVAWQSETRVSRRVAGGETLTQVVRRTIGPLENTKVEPSEFTIPSGYRFQEPVIGGASGKTP
ncbi:MAG: hypothetical protein WB973_07315 [Thermoanaerobaculia bacterium]